jgi:hypothetical protein
MSCIPNNQREREKGRKSEKSRERSKGVRRELWGDKISGSVLLLKIDVTSSCNGLLRGDIMPFLGREVERLFPGCICPQCLLIFGSI